MSTRSLGNMGEESAALYLQKKFEQILEHDSKVSKPMFVDVKYDFIKKFTHRLITNPDKKIMIGITPVLHLQIIPVGLHQTEPSRSTIRARQGGVYLMAVRTVSGQRHWVLRPISEMIRY